MRKLGDSNPRYGYPYGSLANCWFQPLTQTSKCSAYGNRTRVSAVRGPRPRPLDESALFHKSNAEAGGFEPPVRLPVRQFSKLLVSATHPNFQYFLCGSVFSQTRCKDKRSFRPVQAFEAFFSYLFLTPGYIFLIIFILSVFSNFLSSFLFSIKRND